MITSRDVVNQVCKKLGTKQVGHAGTLDPMATGVLLVAVGPATRLVNHLHEFSKTYRGKFQFGVESTTDDRLGEITVDPDAIEITKEQLQKTVPDFVGRIEQVPPKFSAVKVKGERAYNLARKGVDVKLKGRMVDIHKLSVTGFSYPDFELEIECGTGTYVRSIGRDLAKTHGTKAMMTELVRTSIGHFDVTDAIELADFAEGEPKLLSPLECVRGYPKVMVTEEQLGKLIDGNFIKHDYIAEQAEISTATQSVVAVDKEDNLMAVLTRFDENNFKPKINFCKYWLNES